MRIGFGNHSRGWDICDVIDETQERISYYKITPDEVRKRNIETCLYEIFETYRFLKEPEPYQNVGIEGRRALANCLITWHQLHPEDNQVDEWMRIWEFNHGGLT